MPVVFVWEYKIGYMLLNGKWPERLSTVRLHWSEWRNWKLFWKVFEPTLVGSVFCCVPAALVSFFVTRGIMARHQRKKNLPAPATGGHIAKD